jgi:hypothetical protein
MPRYLIKRTDLANTKWNRSRLCERLITDIDFSLAAAILELKYWENYWKSRNVTNVWRHTVASYNGGFKAKPTSKYVADIKKRIQALRTYFKQKEIKWQN